MSPCHHLPSTVRRSIGYDRDLFLVRHAFKHTYVPTSLGRRNYFLLSTPKVHDEFVSCSILVICFPFALSSSLPFCLFPLSFPFLSFPLSYLPPSPYPPIVPMNPLLVTSTRRSELFPGRTKSRETLGGHIEDQITFDSRLVTTPIQTNDIALQNTEETAQRTYKLNSENSGKTHCFGCSCFLFLIL